MTKAVRFLCVPFAVLLLAGGFAWMAYFSASRLEDSDRWLRNIVHQQAAEEALLVMHALDTQLEAFQPEEVAPLQERVRELAGSTRVIRLVIGIPDASGENLMLVASEPPIQAGSPDERRIFDSILAQVRELPPSSNGRTSCSGYLPFNVQPATRDGQRLTSIAMQESAAGCWRILVGWRERSAIRTTMDASFWSMPQMQEIIMAATTVAGLALFLLIVVGAIMARVGNSATARPRQGEAASDSLSPRKRQQAEQLTTELEHFFQLVSQRLPDVSSKGQSKLMGLILAAQQIRNIVTSGASPVGATHPPPADASAPASDTPDMDVELAVTTLKQAEESAEAEAETDVEAEPSATPEERPEAPVESDFATMPEQTTSAESGIPQPEETPEPEPVSETEQAARQLHASTFAPPPIPRASEPVTETGAR